MKTIRLFSIFAMLLALCLSQTASRGQEPQAASQSKKSGSSDSTSGRAQTSTGGNLPVTGGGILGRLPKWIGSNSSTAVVGDSSIFESKEGHVGIGTDGPRAKLEIFNRTDGGIALFAVNQGAQSVGIVGSSPSPNGIGVQGVANDGDGVLGIADSFDPPHAGGPAGVSGSASVFFGGGLAGRFNGVVRIEKLFSFFNPGVLLQPGDLAVEGKLNVSGTKNFKIDHPLDPENKYLYHAAVESSEVLNLYSGNVQLNEKGEAVVRLPDWFQALNRDFRYSLTPLGASMPGLHIAEKVSGNTFKIAGGAANSEVSWQLIGVRSDPVMLKYPFNVEEDKPERERGRYLNHDAYDLPANKSIHWEGGSYREQRMARQLKSTLTESDQMRKQK